MIANTQESTRFIQSLKRAGIEIGNEQEVIERLGEAREWHFAFATLPSTARRSASGFRQRPERARRSSSACSPSTISRETAKRFLKPVCRVELRAAR